MKRLFGIALAMGVAAMLSTPPAAAADHAAVGAEKCAKVCHKVQFESWSKSKHATATDQKADCETCHGNGADYVKLSVMKDPVKAQAAGLIAKPDKASCTKSCHKPAEITPENISTVHAHKAKAS